MNTFVLEVVDLHHGVMPEAADQRTLRLVSRGNRRGILFGVELVPVSPTPSSGLSFIR